MLRCNGFTVAADYQAKFYGSWLQLPATIMRSIRIEPTVLEP
jgi:hypothetical protein